MMLNEYKESVRNQLSVAVSRLLKDTLENEISKDSYPLSLGFEYEWSPRK